MKREEPLRKVTSGMQVGEDFLVEAGEETDEKVPRLMCSRRLGTTVLLFVALFTATTMRASTAFALVCMTQRDSALRPPNPLCPPLFSVNTQGLYEFKWSSELQGFFLSAAYYGFIFGPVISGFLCMKIGGKRVMISATVLTGICHVFIPEGTRYNKYFFFGLRVFIGFFGGFMFPAFYDIVSHWAPPHERQLLVGIGLSGVPFSSIVTFPSAGVICAYIGWEWIFYMSTMWNFLCAFIFFFLLFDYPKDVKRIDPVELEYITKHTEHHASSYPIPWYKIFTSVPFYAYILVHFSINYAFLTLLFFLPAFMKDVHNFDLASNGTLTALPYIAAFIIRVSLSLYLEAFRIHLNVTRTCIRKVNTCIGVFLASSMLLTATFLTCQYRYWSMACFIVAMMATELILTGGYILALIDMAPAYCSILSGIAQTFANLSGLIGPNLTGIITSSGEQREWNYIWYINIGLYLFSGFTFIVFGTSELLPWGKPPPRPPPSPPPPTPAPPLAKRP